MGDDSVPHRGRIGGLWTEIGTLQFQFMVSQGLMPKHKFLDVGCGCLRGGVHFIKYLENGHYFGIDKNQQLLDQGLKEELTLAQLQDRKVHLLCSDIFDFGEFKMKFDFAIAQSVFTHMPWNNILRCLGEVKKVLLPNGKFFVTFFEDPDGTHVSSSILHAPGEIVTFSDRDPFHYSFSTFEELADRLHLKVNLIGDWNHPRNQKMMVFAHG